MKRLTLVLVVVVLGALAAPAWGAGARSYVSPDGVDGGGAQCERSSPCRSFTYAASRTSSGGEVIAMESGVYFTTTVTKSIELVAPRGVHAVISPGSGAAVTVSAAQADLVTLRNLVLRGNGAATGVVINGGEVELRNVRIARFTGHGVASNPASPADLTVVDSDVVRNGSSGINLSAGESDLTVRRSTIERNAHHGINVGAGSRHLKIRHTQVVRNGFGGIHDNNGGGAGTLTIEHGEISRNAVAGNGYGVVGSGGRLIRLRDVDVSRNTWGVSGYNGAIVEIRDADIRYNAFGVLLSANGAATRVTIEQSTLTQNNWAIWPEGGAVRVSRSILAFNTTAIQLAWGGTVHSYGDNEVHDNGAGEAFSGTVGRS